MPRGPNSTNGPVSKTSTPTRLLNEPNIAALEREIAALDDQVQHQLNRPAVHPARVAPNTLYGAWGTGGRLGSVDLASEGDILSF